MNRLSLLVKARETAEYFVNKKFKYSQGVANSWEGARACRVEHACAVEYGITVIEDCKGEKYGTEENY